MRLLVAVAALCVFAAHGGAFAQPVEPQIITLSCKTTHKSVGGTFSSSSGFLSSGSIVVNLAKGTVSGSWQGPLARITHADDVEIAFEGEGPDWSWGDSPAPIMSVSGHIDRVTGKIAMVSSVTPPASKDPLIFDIDGTCHVVDRQF